MANTKRTTLATGKRFYQWGDEAYWSVTTILNNGVPKPALLPWGIKMVAEAAVAATKSGILAPMVEQNEADAIRWLKGAPYAKRDEAADIGTTIHAAAEAYSLGKPFPAWGPAVAPRMQQFQAFLADHKPNVVMTEAAVYNTKERYAGTLDAILELGGRTLVVDYKTGTGVYPEVGLQLAAYRHAGFVGMPDGSRVDMPATDGAVCLHLPADGPYRLHEVRVDDEIFAAFLYVREVYRFQNETGETVLSDYVPATPEEVTS